MRDDPYWTSRKNSLELLEVSTINAVSIVSVSACSNTGSIRDRPPHQRERETMRYSPVSNEKIT